MAKGAKSSVPQKVLIAKDVIFGTLIRDVTTQVIAEQGVVILFDKETGKTYLPPIFIPHEYFGEEIKITVRDITNEVILEQGEDDFYEEDLVGNSKIMPVDNWHEIKNLVDECKMRVINKNSTSAATAIAGFALSAVCFVLLRKGFFMPSILYVGTVLGILLGILCGIRPTVRLVQALRSEIIWDSAGNYININTGETNLNGGMKIPID